MDNVETNQRIDLSKKTTTEVIPQHTPREFLNQLMLLQNKFFSSETDAERSTVETQQRHTVQQLELSAAELLTKGSDSSIPNQDRNHAMGQYGIILDQLAVMMPWPDQKSGMQRDIQDRALSNLITYYKDHSDAAEVAKAIFMLYHHGVGINKDLTAAEYQSMVGDYHPSLEYSQQYLIAEAKAKKYLEEYIALKLNRSAFDLDTQIDELTTLDESDDEKYSLLLDSANWYRRVALHQKTLGEEDARLTNVEKGILIYKKLSLRNPAIQGDINRFYAEQGINDK